MRSNILFAILIALRFIGFVVGDEILSPNISPSNPSAFVNESANLSEAFLNCASRCSLNKECIGITLFKYLEENYSPAVNSYFCSTDLNVTSPHEIDDKNSTVVYKLMFRNKLKKVVRRPIVVLGRPRRQALFPAQQMLKELIKIRNDSSTDSSTEANTLLDSNNSNSEDLPKQEETTEQTSSQPQDNRQIGQNESEKANTIETISPDVNLETAATSPETSILASTAENDSKNVNPTDPPILQNETEIPSNDKPTTETGDQGHAKDSGVSTEETTMLGSTVETSTKSIKQTDPPARIMNRTNPSEDEEVEELIKELGSSTENTIAQPSTSSTPLVVLTTEIPAETSTTPLSESSLTSQASLESNNLSTESPESSTVVLAISNTPTELSIDTTETSTSSPTRLVILTTEMQETSTKSNSAENHLTSQTPLELESKDGPTETPEEGTTVVSTIFNTPTEFLVDSNVTPKSTQSAPPLNEVSAEIPERMTTPKPAKILVTSEIPLHSPSPLPLPSAHSSAEMPEATTSAFELIITPLNSQVPLLPNTVPTHIAPVKSTTLGLALSSSPLTPEPATSETNSTVDIPLVTTNTPENSEAIIFTTDMPALSSTSGVDDITSFTPKSIPAMNGEIGKPGSNDSQSGSIETTAMPTDISGLTDPTSRTPFPIYTGESDIFATDRMPTSSFPIPGPTTPYPILVEESDMFKAATHEASTKISSGIIRPTPHYPKNRTKSYEYGTTDTKEELVEIFDSDSKECYFEDREMFRRNILAGTYAVLDGEPVLLTFAERSSCVATFSKNGHHGVFHKQNLLPGFPLQQVDAAAYIDDTLYLFDSFEGDDQSVHSFKFDSKLGIYEKTNPRILTRSDFLARHCGMLLPSNVTVKAFAQLSSNASYSCIILDKTRVPIVSIAASHETKTLARAINYVLETEFVPYAEAVFTWLDESLSTVHVFGSDGELYALTRDVSQTDHWKYRVIPYSQFPV